MKVTHALVDAGMLLGAATGHVLGNSENPPPDSRNIRIAVSPVGCFTESSQANLGLEFERKFVLGLLYEKLGKQASKEKKAKWVRGNGIGFFLSYHLHNFHADGWYLKGALSIQRYQAGITGFKRLESGIIDDEKEVMANGRSVDFMGGRQWTWNNGMSIDLAAGLRYISGLSDHAYAFCNLDTLESDAVNFADLAGYQGNVELMLGYSF